MRTSDLDFYGRQQSHESIEHHVIIQCLYDSHGFHQPFQEKNRWTNGKSIGLKSIGFALRLSPWTGPVEFTLASPNCSSSAVGVTWESWRRSSSISTWEFPQNFGPSFSRKTLIFKVSAKGQGGAPRRFTWAVRPQQPRAALSLQHGSLGQLCS